MNGRPVSGGQANLLVGKLLSSYFCVRKQLQKVREHIVNGQANPKNKQVRSWRIAEEFRVM